MSKPFQITIKKCEHYPRIHLIKESVSDTTTFSFMPAEIEGIIKEISNLDYKNNGTFNIIPTR